MVDPLMHVLMGLTNDNLNEIKKDCRKIDSLNESGNERRDILIRKLYDSLAEKQKMMNSYNECSRELKDIREILPLIVDTKYKEAENRSSNFHKTKLTKANKKKERQECSSKFCLLFPLDIQQGYDRKIECAFGCQPHTLCEALHDFHELPLIWENGRARKVFTPCLCARARIRLNFFWYIYSIRVTFFILKGNLSNYPLYEKMVVHVRFSLRAWAHVHESGWFFLWYIFLVRLTFFVSITNLRNDFSELHRKIYFATM